MKQRVKQYKISRQRGAILPVVLWVIVICLVVAGSYAANTRMAVAAVKNTQDAVVLKYAARSGIYITLQQLLGSTTDGYLQHTNKKATGHSFVLEDVQVTVSIKAESDKVSVNTASVAQIRTVLEFSGIEQNQAATLAARIVDWRDSDKLRQPGGMEDADYNAAGYKYGAKDAMYSDLEELRLVAGVDAEIFPLFADIFSLYSDRLQNIYRIRSVARDRNADKAVAIDAVIQLTNQPYKPYRVLKWSRGEV
ncbi:MAG: type II secretion system protein GspK [Gammaproteobacteria bacterium]|nr:type II secretion system protein GspK [Gammaproteobacteria bacterium]MDH5652914.1 type II secretion system protein GspK [Gammaproteobacteria bacterium]